MRDSRKTKAQLQAELERLRAEVSARVGAAGDAPSTAAGQAALAAETVRRRRSEAALHSALMLNRYMKAASAGELVQFCLEEAQQLTGSRIGFFHFVDAGEELIELVAWSKATRQQCYVPSDTERRYPLSKAGVWVDCLRERRAVIHNDYASLPHRKGMPRGHVPVLREAVVPVFEGERIVAILGVGNKPTDYDQDDVDQLTLLAEHAWFMIQRRRTEEHFQAQRDRLEQMVAERTAALLASKERLQGMVEATSDSLWEVNADGRYTYVSPRVKQLLGYEPGQLLGKTPFDLMSPAEAARIRKEFGAILRAKRPFREMINVNLHADGSEVVLETSGLPIFGAKGELMGYRGIDRDITQRTQTEQELSRYRQRLEELVRERTADLEAVNRELDAFAYSVSHDLRAPLRAIDGFSQALLEECTDEVHREGRHFLGRIREGVGQMAQLIDDLLVLSRVTRKELHREPVDLSAIAREICQRLGAAGGGRAVELDLADGIVVEGDGRLLRQMMENLLGNAWKFTSGKLAARIEFGETQRDGQRVLFVRDNGAGFDMRYVDKLFGAFQRLHSSAEFEGTGIGLAIVKRIVDRHGGRVWAEGRVGEGAAFHVALPPAKEHGQ